jgi:hypothetical protein
MRRGHLKKGPPSNRTVVYAKPHRLSRDGTAKARRQILSKIRWQNLLAKNILTLTVSKSFIATIENY